MDRKEIKKEIGENIVYFRKQKKIRQNNLAKMIGMTSAYLCDIEKGRVMPSLKTIYKIVEVIDIEILDFFRNDLPKEERSKLYDRKNLGRRIYVLRRNKFIKQRELAKMINKSNNYLCDIEKGRTNPSLEVLYLIAEKLDVEVWKLFI